MQVSLLAARLTPNTCMHTVCVCLQDVNHEVLCLKPSVEFGDVKIRRLSDSHPVGIHGEHHSLSALLEGRNDKALARLGTDTSCASVLDDC